MLVAAAIAVWLAVGSAFLRGMRSHRLRLGDQLSDPIAEPFGSLAVITPMLAAADALYPLSHSSGTVAVDALLVVTVALAGWFTGQ